VVRCGRLAAQLSLFSTLRMAFGGSSLVTVVSPTPLNATARAALTAYLRDLADTALYLFPSVKTGQALTERALGHLIKKYATRAHLSDVRPHDSITCPLCPVPT